MTALRPERDGAPYGEYDAQDAYAHGEHSAFGEQSAFGEPPASGNHLPFGEQPEDPFLRSTTAYGAASYGDADRFHAGAYGDASGFEAAVEQLADPLNDPLPGQGAATHDPLGGSGAGRHGRGAPAQDGSAGAYATGYAQPSGQPAAAAGRHSPGWFHEEPSQAPEFPAPRPFQDPHQPQQPQQPQHPHQPHHPQPHQPHQPPPGRPSSRRRSPAPEGLQAAAQPAPEPAYEPGVGDDSYEPAVTDETTVSLNAGEARHAADQSSDGAAAGAAGSAGAAGGAAAAAGLAGAAAAGGRAARRRAAKQRGGGGGRRRAGARHDSRAAGRGGHRARGHRAGGEPAEAAGEQSGGESEAESAPLSRVEARRAARAAKPSAGVVASRAIGEFFISMGVLMLLFVAYQLWWTNVRAHEEADGAAQRIQTDWANGKGKPGVFAPGQGFAIMHIPKLDVIVPIAQGTDKHKVLDRGMVGHYGGPDDIQTAMPDAKTGNFAVAGHRNTHGEPFRYINHLVRGDDIVVETQDEYYVYKVTSLLPQTAPSNIGVIGPIPPGSGFTEPGRYITLTTCTPEYTSKYRLIVWGKMVEERPRAEGKPKALVN
ncbi:class E sortase [Streptomyces sp. TS71-3]|uniref:class E sortase n=1 Tax=Streptomyces sp. TS71-3 TaxID=2733862 RepID=UPI001B04F6F6|nr:class E sortase [Streptomyces sp. TS71-3]GHJ40281.1 hypothetical protein Sm713_58900 [Streptomyces sp. TS71-3]